MTAPLAATSSVATTAPFGRRLCEVTENRASGGYRVFSLLDADGPEPLPGQFYMLATETRWEEQGERPFLPRALSVADATPAVRSSSAADPAAHSSSAADPPAHSSSAADPPAHSSPPRIRWRVRLYSR